MAAVSLFTPPTWPPWRHVNTLYNKDVGDDEAGDDDSDDIRDGDYENWLHPNHVLIVNYLKSIFKVV